MSEIQAPAAALEMGTGDPGPTAESGSARPPAPPAAGMWQPTQGQMFDPRRKSPLLASVLSIVPGVGQFYIGYYMRGFMTAAAFLVAVLTAASLREPLGPVFGMTAMFVWIFNLIDAGRMAALYNHAAAGTDVVEMPEDFKLPRVGGSILGGIALLLFGGIALSNTAFGYSLEWLEDWWPVFPLALGVYLFARGVMDVMGGRQDSKSSYDLDEDLDD